MDNKSKFRLKLISYIKTLTSIGLLLLILFHLILVSRPQALAQVPNNENPVLPTKDPSRSTIKIEFLYSGEDLTEVSTAANDFADLLSLETGLDIQVGIQNLVKHILEDLGAGRADLAPMSSMAYVIGHEEFGIEAMLVNGIYFSYASRGQINVATASGYLDLWDLQGKSFSAADAGSVTSYILPYMLILNETGMSPTEFFGEIVFAGSHNQVIEDVYAVTVDCGGSYDDARGSVLAEYPDVYDIVSVIAYTDYYPNDPWAYRQGLDPEVIQKLKDGIIAVAGTTQGESDLEKIFGYNLTGIKTTQDSAYDIVRQIVDTFGWSLGPFHRIFLPIVVIN